MDWWSYGKMNTYFNHKHLIWFVFQILFWSQRLCGQMCPGGSQMETPPWILQGLRLDLPLAFQLHKWFFLAVFPLFFLLPSIISSFPLFLPCFIILHWSFISGKWKDTSIICATYRTKNNDERLCVLIHINNSILKSTSLVAGLQCSLRQWVASVQQIKKRYQHHRET